MFLSSLKRGPPLPAKATAKRLRVEADKLGRRVEKSAAARSGGYRAKWIEAEQAAKEAELAALVLRWVEAERAARHAEAKGAELNRGKGTTSATPSPLPLLHCLPCDPLLLPSFLSLDRTCSPSSFPWHAVDDSPRRKTS